MKKKFLLLLITVAMAISTVGCNKNENSESSSQAETTGTIATSQAESKLENMEYNGTFNEEVFNQIRQNIEIGDKTISLPCTLEDLGEGFESGGVPYFDDENEMYSAALLYKDSTIGYYTAWCTEDDKDIKDNELIGISFSYSDFKKQGVITDISIGEITFQDTKEKVQEKFGVPSIQDKRPSGILGVYYKISDTKMIRFDFDDNNMVILVSIYNY